MTEDLQVAYNSKLNCDLTPCGLGQVECDARIEFGAADDPEGIEICFPTTPVQVGELYSSRTLELARYFGALEFEGLIVDSGTRFRGKFVLVTRMQPVGMLTGVRLSCAVEDFEFLDGTEDADRTILVFRLTNVPHRLRGDVAVVRPVSDHVPSPLETDYFATSELHALDEAEKKERFRPGWQFSASRINFAYGGLMWSLDTTRGHGTKNDKASQLLPMVTATLTTKAVEDEARLRSLADDICDLLTFAFGKEVRWVSCGSFSRKDASRSYCRAFPLLPYGKGAGALIDNWETGNLKQFLQECEAKFNLDRDWWHRSIGLVAHSRATHLLEIRLSTLNTLVDRISKKVVGEQRHPEIDAELPNRIKRRWFRWILHQLLRTLSPTWDQKRTDNVCETIVQWNSSPSFPNQVVRACETLGIAAPARKQLGFRHKLMHVGEFDQKLKTIEDMVTYLQSLEAVVELMMVQLLGFTGYVHIDQHGPTWQKVEAILSAKVAV